MSLPDAAGRKSGSDRHDPQAIYGHTPPVRLMEYGLVALWLAAYLAIGALSLPVATALFSEFHDRGAAFAIPIGLLTIAVGGYLVGHLAFGWPALVAGCVVLAAASLRSPGVGRRVRRSYAEVAAVFAVGFLFVISIRAVSPAVAPLPISAGEKFLDYGLVRSLLRADTLPPEDVWFAGETVQYYYGGQMLTALLATLTGTEPRYAYNLGLAGFYAALVTAAYGLAGAIAAEHGTPRRFAAALGAFFVGVAGNLHTAAQAAAWALPGAASVPGTGADSWSPSAFHYWDASRIIEGTINEFPLFAWLNGDLHAHMLTTPFTLLAAALCYSYWRTPEAETGRRVRLLAATVPVAGFLAVTNTWDFPVVGGVGVPDRRVGPVRSGDAAPGADRATVLETPVGVRRGVSQGRTRGRRSGGGARLWRRPRRPVLARERQHP